MKLLFKFQTIALALLISYLPINTVLGQTCTGCASNDPSSPVGIAPGFATGNPALCAGGTRVDPYSGTYNLDAFGNTVTITVSTGSCGQVVSWSVSGNIVIDHVIVKGGPDANDYNYTAENPRPTSDGNLHAPLSPGGNGCYAGLSHIDFCYHYRLSVSKTANAEYTRTYDWAIDKSCNGDASLTLSPGQTYNYPFSWTASVSGFTDSDWKVTGSITVNNNTPYTATITGISDVLSGGINATLSCGITFPYPLSAGATLNCTYSADLPNGADGTNTVTVTTSTPLVEGNTATADYAFGLPTTEVDECITVTDDCTSATVACASTSPTTKNYYCPIGPYEVCGDYVYTNTASFTTNDQGATGSDDCTVGVNVPCEGGCTLTPGYWKTHSEFGPAPYDDTWAQLPNSASTVFFLSGQTYYEVLWTAPLGNAYYILAHAYIAAQLNFLNGADPSTAQAAFDQATTLFQTYTPAQIAALKGNKPPRPLFISLALTLDNYNNGLIGPGHCSEESNGYSMQAHDPSNVLPHQPGDRFRLIPNPAQSSVRIDVSEFIGLPATLRIYDQLGALVWSRNYTAVDVDFVTVELDQRNFTNGVYQVSLTAEGYHAVQTLVIQRGN